ncbi:abasic site processing protein HMCES isoform X2 [Hippopotamus amphibius kiboko]|uniref:abasic site processing protein HMCES isoform X2 n=1 Tax=Hippopotamus amphibius kiboko TaxID=575201 RepID=UPI0025957DAD|nr:abasic site processing protein HMCES isoform X2 [Hippopotamus amphibius kiboko]
MCGRTCCHLPREVLARACAYRDRQGRRRLPEWRGADGYQPSYNKSPQSCSPVLLSRRHVEKGADSSERIIAPMQWGLVPFWFKETDPSKLPFHTSNCRSDTIMEKRSFRLPLEKGRRCVVLADGFYEWRQCPGKKKKQPYFIYFPQIKTEKSESAGAADGPEDWEKVWDNWRPLTMAGIFDCWQPPEGGDCLYSYTVITVDACRGLNNIHHRLRWVFIAAHGLSLVVVSHGYFSLWCTGSSFWWLLLWNTGSRRARFGSCGPQALELGLSSCGARSSLLRGMWDLPSPGTEPVSPRLAGRFLITMPPGKSLKIVFKSTCLGDFPGGPVVMTPCFHC